MRSIFLLTSYIRGHAFFYGATPGFFQRRQLGHGFILIIKERQHVADNGRGCCHVAAMFKYAGRRIARIVCWRETLKQGMIPERSEERREGTEGVSTLRTRWTPYH